MPKRTAIWLWTVFLAAVAGPVYADMVILKSGEMFQTRKAWKQDRQVFLYRDDRIVRFDEKDVERVIHDPIPEDPQPDGSQPETPSSPAEKPSAAGLPPQAGPPAGDDAGYHGYQWGMPPSQVADLNHVGTDPAYGGVQQYVQSTDGRRFGRARVDRIVLGFWQDGLYTIVVEVNNFLDFRDLRAESFRRFGIGLQKRADVERYFWIDAAADRLLAYDAGSDSGYLWMRSRSLHNRVKANYPK
ncbi:MAG TPA: hypothetical protein VLT88_02465 [Desulfosarcina sp.]|nr:hypothetical protein [Desulfosarcina sp.]